ncbi:MAG: hypothetical protein HY368_00430 [Candidatus Aenigmarchaeota archaeon]|nr:hypothetical protein [Candidatus Aenigmarchaeota archaeon]
MAKKRRKAATRKTARKASKETYMCAHCGTKSGKAGMCCGAMCEKC